MRQYSTCDDLVARELRGFENQLEDGRGRRKLAQSAQLVEYGDIVCVGGIGLGLQIGPVEDYIGLCSTSIDSCY